MLKEAGEKRYITYKEVRIQMTADFFEDVRRKWQIFFKC